MFERYTEKARRVVFFARYEASQYGSAYINTEHLLLGLLRENRELGRVLFGTPAGWYAAREEIEKHVTRGERIPTSAEVPISEAAKQVMMFAFEEAERLGHKFVGTEHLFLGLARVEYGVAASILTAHGMTIEKARGMIHHVTRDEPISRSAQRFSGPVEASTALETFLNTLRAGMKMDSLECLAPHAQYIDAQGRCWVRKEILEAHLEELFGRYTTRNARYILEEVVEQAQFLYIANVLWEPVRRSERENEPLRMTVTLAPGEEGSHWLIYAIQVTPVDMHWPSEGI